MVCGDGSVEDRPPKTISSASVLWMNGNIEERDLSLVLLCPPLSTASLENCCILDPIAKAMANEGLHIVVADDPNCFTSGIGAFQNCVLDGEVVWCKGHKGVVPGEVVVQLLSCDWNDPCEVECSDVWLFVVYLQNVSKMVCE